MFRIPNSKVYAYVTDARRNESASARLLTGRVADAENVTLSLSAFLQALQYSLFSRLARD